ncbi:hypothetical protein MUK42_34693 [Musa troglodytarum]|uniref:Uncharacterized protein n=1 Tax=Musa troglodytarum TaxID=320322 RepID=A0A9E7JA27_9LILI|nr:hypothetical protein MUK42_34693 [Musa troglodytarum]
MDGQLHQMMGLKMTEFREDGAAERFQEHLCDQEVLALKRSVHSKTAGELIDVDVAEERAAEIVPVNPLAKLDFCDHAMETVHFRFEFV